MSWKKTNAWFGGFECKKNGKKEVIEVGQRNGKWYIYRSGHVSNISPKLYDTKEEVESEIRKYIKEHKC